MADGGEAIGGRCRVFLCIGQIDDGRAEHRPVAGDLHTCTDAHFLAVAQILTQRGDVAVEPGVADRRIGAAGADRSVDLVAADRQIILVETETVSQPDNAAQRDGRPPDNVRRPPGQAAAIGEQRRTVVEPVALADTGGDGEAGAVESIVDAIGDACPILETVIAGKAVEREKIAVLQFEGAAVFIGNIDIVDGRRGDELDARG